MIVGGDATYQPAGGASAPPGLSLFETSTHKDRVLSCCTKVEIKS